MKHKLTLYYSVSNGGDGSAYPQFSLSKELAEIHQEMQNELYEGWGEPCTGEITIESDSLITVSAEEGYNGYPLITKESLIADLEQEKRWVKGRDIWTIQEFIERINAVEDEQSS